MSEPLADILAHLGRAILESPVLSVMVVDREMNIVWHNASFARGMGAGPDLIGRKCYEVAEAGKVHAGCPTRISLGGSKYTRGLYDFGDRNGLVITIPLPDGLAAKVHVFLPKEADNRTEEIDG